MYHTLIIIIILYDIRYICTDRNLIVNESLWREMHVAQLDLKTISANE